MTDWTHVRDWLREHTDYMGKAHWGKVALPSNCTEATWDTTYAVCKGAMKRGYLFACEVKMNNGRRADIIIPELSLVVEIFDSETIDSMDAKKLDYRCNVLFIPAIPEEAEKLVFGAKP